ncbi:MAG: alanine racemase, partial [Balneolaceae bacterium]|nr:alanine racemase [Balneolaceae bacterium]
MSDRTSSTSFVEVNLEAIQHNGEVLRAFLNDDTKQMVVVKANAYGHGAVQVANALKDVADWFAVYTEGEGIELRENGIDTPILV